jgi:hypothetical protein
MSVIEVVITKMVMIPRGLVAAAVLGGLVALFVQCVVRLGSASRSRLLAVGRLFLGLAAATLVWVYGILALPWLALDASSIAAFLAAFVLLAGWTLFRALRAGPPEDGGRLFVAHGVLLIVVALAGAATLVTAGFLNLTEDRPVLLVDVTGETGTQVVHWAPPDADPRVESLMTHRVIFRRPAGEAVADAWIYGDEVAVKGRVLRLSPWLNAAGLPNLFELTFAHNGYTTAERHNTMPHEAVALPPMGSLAVHALWRPLQARLLTALQTRADPNGTWTIRATTMESTYFPLVDREGKPTARTFRLVLTPGGLTAS